MKKNYLIPSTKVIDTKISTSVIECSTGNGKGGTSIDSKKLSDVDNAGSDDDFWSSAQ